jgi:hypothetical protein
MKKLMIVLAVPMTIVAALTVAEVSGGCGLLDAADEIWIGPITQTFEFDLDANDIRTQLETQLGVSLAGLTEFPAQVGDFQRTLEIETPPEKVDLSGEEDLKKYVEAGKIKSVKIESIKYNATQNTLNYDIPGMEIYMDDYAANEITASSKLIATLPTIAAGTTEPKEVDWASNGKSIMNDFLMSFKFAIMGKTSVEIDTTKNRAIPAGRMIGTVEVKVKFSVDPIP